MPEAATTQRPTTQSPEQASHPAEASTRLPEQQQSDNELLPPCPSGKMHLYDRGSHQVEAPAPLPKHQTEASAR